MERDTFGRPDDFAEAVANERQPADVRAAGDPDAMTATDYAVAVTGQLGLMTFGAGAYEFVTNGLMTSLTTSALLGCVAIAAVALAAVALVEGPDTVIAHVPTPAICALGILLPAWVLFSKPPTAPAHERLPSEAWLHKLPRLLEGCHALPRARAAELTREASRQLAESGREPEDEFGPVAAYARQLAKAKAPRQHWWQRNDVRSAVGTAFFGVYLVNNLHDQGPMWLTLVAAVGTYTSTASLIAHLRRDAGRGRRSST
ncbi:hypothetical protein [Streptomyces sp. BRA346]|uniref:hypothetical protein n=1 Tax=Streptomyces sp. BRA346 TaxID=2878199 RepID=UPI004063F1EB